MFILLMIDDMDPASKRVRKGSARSKYNKLTKAQKQAILRYWGEKRLSIASITQHFSEEWEMQLSYRGVAEIISYWKATGQIRGSKAAPSCSDIVSELEAIIHIFDEMDGKEGILVASKIADRVGITRSVIVNALRKFESAGVIESRSSGMKGTYIKVLNDVVFDELDKIKKQNQKK